MKFYKNQQTILFKEIKANTIQSLLLYGPDKSAIAVLIHDISDILDLSVTNIDYKDINDMNFPQVARSSTLFAERSIIVINNTSSSIPPGIVSFLETTYENFIVFVADELTPSSKIRKCFELSKKNLAILPCYINDKGENLLIARQEFTKYNKQISPSNLKLFCELVPSTIHDIKSEVQKLVNFIASDVIDEEAIIELSYSENVHNSDLMCYSFIAGGGKMFYRELQRIFDANINAMWVIRAIIRYTIQAIKVQRSVKSTEDAIRALKPPIFFKSLQSFRALLSTTDLRYLYIILQKLLEAEIALKEGCREKEAIDKLFLSLRKKIAS